MSRTLVVHVDNAGTVGIFNKGHWACGYASTLAKVLGITLRVVKITRCSDKGSVLADAISKGDIRGARGMWPLMGRLVPPPSSLVSWIKMPVVRGDLGSEILRELEQEFPEIVI